MRQQVFAQKYLFATGHQKILFFTYRILNRIEMYLPNTPSSFRAVSLGKVFRKKVAVLLDFVQMRGEGEGPAQIFCPLFTNCILGQFGDGEGGGDPCPIFFWHIGVQESGTSCPN